MSEPIDAIRERFQRAAWGKTAWERADRDRPEGLDRWQSWCRDDAVPDVDVLLAANARMAAVGEGTNHE